MRKPMMGIFLLLIVTLLSACNLGAGSVEQPTEVIIQPTSIIVERTKEPTARATITQIPTQVPVPNNNNNNNGGNTPSCFPRNDWATYTVVAGDTLSRIAVRGNTTINNLITGNCLANPNLIAPGQVLRVPNAVAAASPIVVTSTPIPQTNNACRITLTGERVAYLDQLYIGGGMSITAGQTYIITGHNQWNYRVQWNGSTTAWIQKNVPEQPTGNCGIVPEVPLSYDQMASSYTDICYFIPHGNDFNAYDDMARTTTYFSLSGHSYYSIDARADNGYRLVGGYNLAYPVWVANTLGNIQGNCNSLPDFSTSLTLNGSTTRFNTDYPIEFEYPANWVLQTHTDGFGGYSMGTFPRFNFYPGAKGIPGDIVGVSLNYVDNPHGYNAQEFAEAVIADIRTNAPSRVSIQQDPQLFTFASGLEAYHYILRVQNAPSHQYVIEVDEDLYMLSVQGNQSHAVRVIESVRAG